LRVRIEGEPGNVSAVVAVPSTWTGDGCALILGHGAGGDMEASLLVAVADALSEAGVLTMRFNFPYAELAKGAPDPPARLGSTCGAPRSRAPRCPCCSSRARATRCAISASWKRCAPGCLRRAPCTWSRAAITLLRSCSRRR